MELGRGVGAGRGGGGVRHAGPGGGDSRTTHDSNGMLPRTFAVRSD